MSFDLEMRFELAIHMLLLLIL